MHLTFIYQFLFCFHSTLVKTTLSLKRSKHQPQTNKRSFLNKPKSHHFSFTACFIILVYYLLAYKSKPKEGTQVSSFVEYKSIGLEFLEFQNKLQISLNIFSDLRLVKNEN